MSGGLPTPPLEEGKPALAARKPSKLGRPTNRGPKRLSASISHDHGGVILDGRHKRVWKACERCRMKKTKCDGESPCKRCKDDGLVCTAGSRKKAEFKQLPRGYAEVLENTQYALIATVQKLYAMVRNGESWDLGEPELNDRGLPVIHNIAEKLGCIRPSPDMPQAFPEDAEEFAALQAQLFTSARDGCDSSEGKRSDDSIFSRLDRTDRASSSDSEHSCISNDYGQILWEQQRESAMAQEIFSQNQQTQPPDPPFDDPVLLAPTHSQFKLGEIPARRSFNPRPISSPPYPSLQASSPFRADSPFPAWTSSSDDLMGSPSVLDMNALYLRQQRQFQNSLQLSIPRQSLGGPYSACTTPSLDSARSKGSLTPSSAASLNVYANISPYLASNDGTIQPNMLDCDGSNTNGLVSQIDGIMFGDYDGMTMT